MGILCLTLDVTKEESVERVKSQVEELTNGCLDVLVNNAYVHPNRLVDHRTY